MSELRRPQIWTHHSAGPLSHRLGSQSIDLARSPGSWEVTAANIYSASLGTEVPTLRSTSQSTLWRTRRRDCEVAAGRAREAAEAHTSRVSGASRWQQTGLEPRLVSSRGAADGVTWLLAWLVCSLLAWLVSAGAWLLLVGKSAQPYAAAKHRQLRRAEGRDRVLRISG